MSATGGEGGGGEESRLRIVDNAQGRRYEIYVDDQLAGFSTYRDRAGARVILHSEIDPAFEHHGLGGALARAALDDIRSLGLRVVPQCPFVNKYVHDHPEYADLVRG
jgi:uncharacterized protein